MSCYLIYKSIACYQQDFDNNRLEPMTEGNQALVLDNKLFGVSCIKVERLEPAFKDMQNICSSHRHNFYKIIWVTKGRGTHFIDFNHYPIKPHSLCFISLGQIQTLELTEDVTGYMIMFTNEFFSLELQNKHILSQLPFFDIVNTDPVLYVNDGEAAIFNYIVQKLEREYHSNAIDRDDMLCAFLRILLIEVKRLYCPAQTIYTAESSVLIAKKFMLLIETHFLVTTSVSEYAKILNITANHLNETVKKTTGRTAGEWIRNRLVLEAKRLLIYSELTISEIAYHLNFDNVSYFGRLFKKYTDCSPGDFRGKSIKSDKASSNCSNSYN